jgi:23S rRNA pseudouridine1911/1915/1917 synthase
MTALEGGREAWTSYQVRQRWSEATWVEAVLHTGRTHQVRVHFCHLGHPLAGDLLYGKRANARLEAATGYCAPRQLLHAWILGFAHPRSGMPIEFEAPLPNDFRTAIARLRSSA